MNDNTETTKQDDTQRLGESASMPLLCGTDYQVLEALVPDIRKRVSENREVLNEIMKRCKSEKGFRPFQWSLGCL